MIIAAFVLVLVQSCVALFQLALALGAPMGEYAMGGQNVGRLPNKFRIAAGVSFLVNLAIGVHYLTQTGLISTLLPLSSNTVANWVLVGYWSVALFLNSVSRSKKEKQLWVPVILLSLICSVFVALG